MAGPLNESISLPLSHTPHTYALFFFFFFKGPISTCSCELVNLLPQPPKYWILDKYDHPHRVNVAKVTAGVDEQFP